MYVLLSEALTQTKKTWYSGELQTANCQLSMIAVTVR